MRNIFIILFLVPFAFACNPIQPLEFREVEAVNFDGINGDNATMAVTVKVFNPNNRKFTVTNHDIQVLLNNRAIGRIVDEGEIEVPANSEKTYVLHAEAAVKNITGNIPLLLTIFSQGEANLGLKGNLKVKSFIFSKTLDLDETQKISADEFNFLQ